MADSNRNNSGNGANQAVSAPVGANDLSTDDEGIDVDERAANEAAMQEAHQPQVAIKTARHLQLAAYQPVPRLLQHHQHNTPHS